MFDLSFAELAGDARRHLNIRPPRQRTGRQGHRWRSIDALSEWRWRYRIPAPAFDHFEDYPHHHGM